KAWGDLRALLTDGLCYFRDRSFVERSPSPAIVGADAFVASLRLRHEHSVTVHHGHIPELQVVGPGRARGIWAMSDWVDNAARGFAWRRFGHYAEEYTRVPDGCWRIAVMRLSRIRIDVVPPTPGGGVEDAVRLWRSGELPMAGESASSI